MNLSTLSTSVQTRITHVHSPPPSLEGVVRWTDQCEIESIWNRQPRCTFLVSEDRTTTCGRVAAWHFRFHSCSHGFLCRQHREWWLQAVAELDWPAPCNVCGRVFPSADAACTVAPL